MWILNQRTGTAINIHDAKVISFREVERITPDGPRSAWVVLIDNVEVYCHSKREDVMEKIKGLHRLVSAITLAELLESSDMDRYARNGEEL